MGTFTPKINKVLCYTLTCESSIKSIAFLDTLVKIDPTTREVYTTLYTKPTDTREFLRYTSAHPLDSLKGGPHLQQRCGLWARVQQDLQAYLERSYPKKLLLKHHSKASQFAQDELLLTKEKKSNDKQEFVTRFNPSNPDVTGIIRKFWPIWHTNRALWALFKDEPKDMLVKAKLGVPSFGSPQENVLT